jgi:hypothetical protein
VVMPITATDYDKQRVAHPGSTHLSRDCPGGPFAALLVFRRNAPLGLHADGTH